MRSGALAFIDPLMLLSRASPRRAQTCYRIVHSLTELFRGNSAPPSIRSLPGAPPRLSSTHCIHAKAFLTRHHCAMSLNRRYNSPNPPLQAPPIRAYSLEASN